LNWNERSILLFDLAARKFYVFCLVLWPQDLIYLAAMLLSIAPATSDVVNPESNSCRAVSVRVRAVPKSAGARSNAIMFEVTALDISKLRIRKEAVF
jgi:hypothetical protein